MATIRPLRDKWQAIIRRKGFPATYKSFAFKRDAEQWARQQERLMDTGQWSDRKEAEQTTLNQLLERYAREVTSTKRGTRAELHRIELFKRSNLAARSVAAINSRLIAEWRDKRQEQVSSGTVLRELCLLSHVFTVAIREWGIGLSTNPVSYVRKPPPGKARDRVLTDEERERLLDECQKCRNSWVYPVVVFALETAARRGEILSLTWSAVNLDQKTAAVEGKTGKRTLPLSPTCITLLKELPVSQSGYVFPVTAETLKQAYERSVRRAGIADFTFHDLRHDAMTRLAKLGLNILELRAISGHTSANMLQRYVSINPSNLAEKINASAAFPVGI